MYKIAIIGDKDSILGFKALGMDVFPVTESIEAEKILSTLVNSHYAVIYITEQISKDLTAAIATHSTKKIPAIIPIPGNQGSLGLGMKGVKRTVEKAVGADILFKNEG